MSISQTELERCRGGHVAIGNFDGVHLGHQRMLKVLNGRARAAGVPSVVMTFDPPPVALLRPDLLPPSLTTIARRTELLKHYEVSEVLVWPTSRELLNLGPREFFDQVIVNQLQATGIVEGPNFFFGKNRSGNVQLLAEFCREANVAFEVVEPVEDANQMVSSSRIRALVSDGDVAAAHEMLGHPYRITGNVVHGAGRGRTLGFPTANLAGVSTLVPAKGVYAGFCEFEGQEYAAAINIGENPTFGDDSAKIEVHLLQFTGDLYTKNLNVDLLCRIRQVRTFDSVEALQAQVTKDIQSAREICAARPSQSR